jgi:hypothetical protein
MVLRDTKPAKAFSANCHNCDDELVGLSTNSGVVTPE